MLGRIQFTPFICTPAFEDHCLKAWKLVVPPPNTSPKSWRFLFPQLLSCPDVQPASSKFFVLLSSPSSDILSDIKAVRQHIASSLEERRLKCPEHFLPGAAQGFVVGGPCSSSWPSPPSLSTCQHPLCLTRCARVGGSFPSPPAWQDAHRG